MTISAVHFGAGSIGRGFLGQLYCESGFHTTFIDVMDSVVAEINRRGCYPVDIVSDTGTQRIVVDSVRAIHGRNRDEAAGALASADIASTAVGLHALVHVAPVIAQAVESRFARPDAPPLDIILCENINGGEAYMRGLVRERLPEALHPILDAKVGFVEASIGRMVPVMTPEQQAADPLLVCVEPYCDLPVDANGFRGTPPPINHLKPMPNFVAYVERKLFVHNLTHAATAYLGRLRGYTFIREAICDDGIRAIVEQAGRESCAALARKHGLDPDALEAHLLDLVRRYHNRALADQIARVARDPVRKLNPKDRLIGAAQLCVEQGIAPKAISVAAAAAILYDMEDDPSAGILRDTFESGGIEAVLRNICELDPFHSPGTLIMESYHQLKDTGNCIPVL